MADARSREQEMPGFIDLQASSIAGSRPGADAVRKGDRIA
jgi:hypothetical protein